MIRRKRKHLLWSRALKITQLWQANSSIINFSSSSNTFSNNISSLHLSSWFSMNMMCKTMNSSSWVKMKNHSKVKYNTNSKIKQKLQKEVRSKVVISQTASRSATLKTTCIWSMVALAQMEYLITPLTIQVMHINYRLTSKVNLEIKIKVQSQSISNSSNILDRTRKASYPIIPCLWSLRHQALRWALKWTKLQTNSSSNRSSYLITLCHNLEVAYST